MHLKKIIMLLAVVGSMMSVFGQLGGKQYFLVDDRTQMPVLCYPMAPNWLSGGKTNWTAHPLFCRALCWKRRMGKVV